MKCWSPLSYRRKKNISVFHLEFLDFPNSTHFNRYSLENSQTPNNPLLGRKENLQTGSQLTKFENPKRKNPPKENQETHLKFDLKIPKIIHMCFFLHFTKMTCTYPRRRLHTYIYIYIYIYINIFHITNTQKKISLPSTFHLTTSQAYTWLPIGKHYLRPKMRKGKNALNWGVQLFYK